MNLAEWRAQQGAGHEIDLSTGLHVRLKNVQLLDLVASGDIPETLDALMKRATSEGFSIKDFNEFMPLIDAVVAACLLEPALGDMPDDQHMTLKELGVSGRMEIFNWANAGANALAPFRSQPQAVVAASSNGRGIRRKAKHAARG